MKKNEKNEEKITHLKHINMISKNATTHTRARRVKRIEFQSNDTIIMCKISMKIRQRRKMWQQRQHVKIIVFFCITAV